MPATYSPYDPYVQQNTTASQKAAFDRAAAAAGQPLPSQVSGGSTAGSTSTTGRGAQPVRGTPGDPTNPWTPGQAGLFAEPGAYENWYKTTGANAFSQPTNAENFYGTYGSQWQNPTQIETMGGVGATGYETWAASTGANAFSQPSIAEQSFGQWGNALSGPGYAERLGSVSPANALASLGPMAAANATASLGPMAAANSTANLGPIQQLAYSPQFAQGLISNLEATRGREQAYNDFYGGFQSPSRSEGLQNINPAEYAAFYSANQGAFLDPSRTEGFADRFIDPSQKSYSELLYESGDGFLNPFYDLASQRAIEASQRASAARGGFNTGLAAQQESDILSSLRGQQAQQMIPLAGQADSQRLGRMGQALDAYSRADENYRNRVLDTGSMAQTAESFGLQRAAENRMRAGQADQEKRARALTALELATGMDRGIIERTMSQADIQRIGDQLMLEREGLQTDRSYKTDSLALEREGLLTDRARSIDSLALDREGLLTDRFRSIDNIALDRDRTITDRARAQDSGMLGRADAFLGYSNAATDAARNRVLDTAGILRDAGDQSLSRATIDTNRAIAASNIGLDRYKTGFDVASGADDAYANRIVTSGNLAATAQTAGQNRLLGGLNAFMGLGDAEAGTISRGYANAGQLSADGMREQINAMVQAGAIDAQQAQQWMEALGLGASIYSKVTK